MIVKLTNPDLASAFLSDVGDLKDKEYRKGANLPYNIEVTLPDNAVTAKSLADGALSKLIASGDVTVVAGTTAVTQMLSHAATATAGQTIFNLPASYVMGNKSLHVFVEGSLQPKPGMTGATYAETNSTRVTFTAGLTLNDDVQFIWSK